MAMMNEMEYRTIGSALAGGYRAAVYCRLSKDDDLQGESASIANQYGFLTVCKNRVMRSFRESALSKVIPLTSGRDSAATAPMSTLLICSSFCVVNFTVNLLRRLIERLPLFGGETQQASTTGMLACCLTPPWDTLSRGLL